jgi:cobalt-zinc-cadmium efflux system membrane fusion protein
VRIIKSRGVALRALRVSGLVLATCLSAACPDKPAAATQPAPAKPKPEQPHSAETHAHEELPTRIVLAAEVIAAAGIETAPVVREALAITLPLPGEVAADPDRSARVASPIAGRLERVAFREGSSVRKGDVLAVVRVPDLGKLRSNLAATLARAKAARINADRLAQLAAKRLASEQAQLDAVATAEAFEVEARAGAEQLSALGLSPGGGASQLSLRAPISGIVVARNAVVGQPLTADEVIADIVDLSEVWFLGRVFEKDLGKLRQTASAEVQLNAYPNQRFGGSVEYIGRQVDPVARTVTARIRLQNKDDLLRVGLFGTAYVSSGEQAVAATLVVPRNAITDIAGKSVAFVREADGSFEVHELSLGDSAAGKVQVMTGVSEGEQVVVQGAFTLKSAVLKTTFAEEEE